MAHLKKDSITVKRGDLVRRGQRLGLCGNSGNSSGPHLHLQVQSQSDLEAEGTETFPVCLRGATRIRWGKRHEGTLCGLMRNDRLISTAPRIETFAPN
jgi:murein DD-endopeptidase MepM/ murein hydrolase activator NlpD